MNYKESLEFLATLPRFPTHAGLERISVLMQKLGNPQNDLKFIHVAGTNGKGSVCSMTAGVLSAAGKHTGLYISPYIICFRERIQVNGEYISETDFARFATIVRDAGVKVTEFEFITAVAFLYYKYKECDIVVLETGLGGRFDATNVISAPLVAIITGIGLDHTAVLGSTIGEIAAEKCGIIKSGSAVVTTYTQKPEAMHVICSYADAAVPDVNELQVRSADLHGNRFIYKGREYFTSLIGESQIENALLAIEAVDVLGIPYDAVKKGIGNTQFPARLELLSNNPTVLLDGAHNPHGAEALAGVLKKYAGATAIIGMLADKNCDEVLSVTLPYLSRVICVTVDNPRALSAEELALKAKAYCENVTTADSLDHALNLTKGDDTVFIFGSLYLASEIRQKAKDFYS
ncbi:MAG: bifunctional folylpolyglutamate synthase/dihydrofolate synthase [Clostridia bacterium]|nr:bifunctional folylpolyglutamate synthase/dihydrofolate synthase [Clostridia bacterium]